MCITKDHGHRGPISLHVNHFQKNMFRRQMPVRLGWMAVRDHSVGGRNRMLNSVYASGTYVTTILETHFFTRQYGLQIHGDHS